MKSTSQNLTFFSLEDRKEQIHWQDFLQMGMYLHPMSTGDINKVFAKSLFKAYVSHIWSNTEEVWNKSERNF